MKSTAGHGSFPPLFFSFSFFSLCTFDETLQNKYLSAVFLAVDVETSI